MHPTNPFSDMDCRTPERSNWIIESSQRARSSRPRIKLDLALRKGIDRASINPILSHESGIKSLSISVDKQRFSGTKRWIKNRLRRPANLLRHYLVGSIEQRLEILQWLHPKLDAFHAKVDTLNAKADLISGQVDLIKSSLESLRAESSRLDSKIHELSMRVRVPLKIDESNYALRTADGFVVIPQTDPLLLLMLYDAGPQGLEPGTRQALIRLLMPEMVFVDVGAHVGTLTLAGARRVGSGGKVVAFEPTPTTFNLLKKTLTLNGLNSVTAHQAACGSRQERRTLFIARVLGHSSLFPLEPNNDSEPAADEAETLSSTVVTVLALDDFFNPKEHVDVVKIDVEGAELEVLAGMSRVIKDNPNIAVIAEFGPSHLKRVGIDPPSWLQAFEAHGLVPYIIDELSGLCQRVRTDEILGVDSVNIAFVRLGSDSQRRLLS